MNNLEKARAIINETDREIARLFEKRMQAASLVAEYKKEHGLSILDASRENELIQKNSEYIEDEVIKEYYVEFLKSTMSISRAYQTRLNSGMRVAYCGVEGAYAHIAAKRLYKDACYIAFPSFEEAYRATENGTCDACVLPIENSYAGDVGNVMDLLFSGSLYATQVLNLEINHCLLAPEGATLDSIKTVVSHTQALSQCADYISKHGYNTEPYPNTAVAAKHVRDANDISVAAIASSESAEIFGLRVLQEKINSSRTNTTRFVSFSRVMSLSGEAKDKINDHFMLVFTVKNEAGALAKTIDIIGNHGYNMRNLRSRPMKELLWSYYFFVEADGNINTQNGKEMLNALSKACDKLKVVGAYHS